MASTHRKPTRAGSHLDVQVRARPLSGFRHLVIPVGGRQYRGLVALQARAPVKTRAAATIPFVALDFETADYQRDSACALAMVRVEDGRIVQTMNRLIRPPRRDFVFSHIHGITWPDVADQPDFAQLWRDFAPLLKGASFLVAHNASFDRSVLTACCRSARLEPPALPFQCTMRLARERWNLYPTRLPDVCRSLKIPLKQHHDALSDAEACARIMMHAQSRPS
ncbi:MAG: 3'-5' exonuclease [Deltaproteobacteria bacterium]|nr:3'-5' exonuclease [Deltaproteobacteria bacterium]